MTHIAASHLTREQRDCRHRCGECRETCLETLAYSLERTGEQERVTPVGQLLDCAALCGLQQELLLRASPLGTEVARLCQAACERCAEECEGMPGDQQMQACARVCRRCAEACARLAGAAAAGS